MAVLNVAVAVIQYAGKILIAKRPEHVHQGGLWEFPGGKVKTHETIEQALVREIKEELALDVISTQPCIIINHDYGDKQVCLQVRYAKVSRTSVEQLGNVGSEGQALQWVRPAHLSQYQFPAANQPILDAILLPETIVISPELAADHYPQWLDKLTQKFKQQQIVVQFRAHYLSKEQYVKLANQLASICLQHHWLFVVNHYELVRQFILGTTKGFDYPALHLTQHHLHLTPREMPDVKVFAACHNQHQLQQAKAFNVNALLISPVQKTTSHPGVKPLGFDRFSQLAQQANRPCYALGGMRMDDIKQVQLASGQGVAGIHLAK